MSIILDTVNDRLSSLVGPSIDKPGILIDKSIVVVVSVTSAPKWSSVVERIQAGSLGGLEHLVEEGRCFYPFMRPLGQCPRLSLDPCPLFPSRPFAGRSSISLTLTEAPGYCAVPSCIQG
ncbi:hypothetical protein C8J56DRAFT_1051631 [Mycena floridula]|nr:hypothetical protein C8J56DRAFT_1051631 [Mycena floridula]